MLSKFRKLLGSRTSLAPLAKRLSRRVGSLIRLWALALVSVSVLWTPSFVHGLPAPKNPPPLHTVQMVQEWIPIADGVHLSATLYMPNPAKLGEKFPASSNICPIAKTMPPPRGTIPSIGSPGRGYVSVRVDIRGFGTSEGRPTNREYSEQEQRDGEQVSHGSPPSPGRRAQWECSVFRGAVSIPFRWRCAPPALKAIIAVDATEELFPRRHPLRRRDDALRRIRTQHGPRSLDTGRPNIRSMKAPWAPASTPNLGRSIFQTSAGRQFWHAPLRPQRNQSSLLPHRGPARRLSRLIPRMFEQVKAPLRRSSDPGITLSLMTPSRDLKSSGETELSAGGTSGSKTATPAS